MKRLWALLLAALLLAGNLPGTPARAETPETSDRPLLTTFPASRATLRLRFSWARSSVLAPAEKSALTAEITSCNIVF